ncbi:MAG: putative toxin-antitoxin system toxin component, PIN family [Clostridiales bacterium]|jgi:putative PIN family toxin of toxin-antitoxin system|nr:putative toxin-antitoxin system toxin component, PIN family [Clostridiales bacterium]
MRVVIDTNVFVSSFFGGKPRKVIELWKKGEITICLTPCIIEEYINVLQRLGLEEEPEIGELIGLLAEGYHISFITKTSSLKIVQKDPAHDKFIECAVALKAEAIITGDKGLKAIRDYMGIKILSPEEFLSLFHRSK